MEISVKYCRLLLVICLLTNQFDDIFALGFLPGWEYWYSLEGITHLKDTATIHTSAKVGIIPVNVTGRGSNTLHPHTCRLEILDYSVEIEQIAGHEVQNQKLDFSNSIFFDMSEFGEIQNIYYDQSEDLSVLSAKKAILDILSSKLVISQSQVEKGQRWGYGSNETGHAGPHSAVYQAEPEGKSVNFLKTRTTKSIENANHEHTKRVIVHKDSKIPHDFHVEDNFSTNKDTMLDGDGADPAFGMTLPVLDSRTNSRIKLEDVKVTSDYVMTQRKSELLQTTLEINEKPHIFHNLAEAEEMIRSNITCVQKYQGLQRSIPCFKVVHTVLQRVSFDDMKTIVFSYKGSNEWLVMVDALGAARTQNSLYLLTTEVIASNTSSPEEIMHALVHLVQLDTCPPKLLLNELFWRAFENPWSFSDEHVTSLVNDRTKLVIGSMVSMVMECNKTWANDVIHQLETSLGVHDPFHHRQMRSTMTQNEMRVHLAGKSVHIYALGNAGQTSSYDYLVSYLNTTESHMQLRFSAVEAISNYEHPEAAELLLQVALTDEEDNVRQNAIQAYKQHPHGGGDLREFMDQKLYRYSNISSVEHKRMRRGLKETLGRIWKGFEFRLKSPSKSWQKNIGSSNVGASFGLIIKNEMELKIGAKESFHELQDLCDVLTEGKSKKYCLFIAPLAGHLSVDVHDEAWAVLNIGILSTRLDVVRIQLCFKGKVEYDLNILGEYGFSGLKDLADLYNNKVKKVVKIVKNVISNFENVRASWKGFSVQDIWLDFVDTVKALPKDVKNLRKVARKILKTLESYADLPPVYERVRGLVLTVTTLFNAIKTDVMTLYNAIVDTVTTTLPWAWDEVRMAITNIKEAFKNILKSPKTSIQNVGKAVTRISAAVAAVLDTREKLVDANILDKDNRPYWCDLGKVLGELREEVIGIEDAIEDNVDWLKGGPDEADDTAGRYTGVDLKTMKNQALSEIRSILQDLLQGPMEHIQQFLEPFRQTYTLFVESVENIKRAWQLLIEGYNEAKTLVNLVFGPKFNKEFPRKYLESKTCGDGFWESTGKNHYEHTGVDIETEIGSQIVAPFNGYIYATSEFGSQQVTMDVEDLKDTQVILDNIQLNDGMNRKQVGAGDVIGTVTKPRWCLDGHVHLSMRKTNVTGDYINPSKYMEKRKMPPPKWREECDHYKLVWLGEVIEAGMVTKDPEVEDETPDLPDAPDSSELEIPENPDNSRSRKKRAQFDNIVDKFETFSKKLGLPGFDKLKEIFSLDIKTVTVGQALDILDDLGLSDLKKKITEFLSKIETFVNQETCTNPNSLDDNELKAALTLRGKSTSGTRQSLISRYLESETKCFGLSSHVSDNIYCSYQSDCLGLSCCLDLKFFIYRHAVTAFVRYDPCLGSVILGVGKWTKMIAVTVDITAKDTIPIETNMNVVNVAQLVVYYTVKIEDGTLLVSLGVRWCSTISEECQELVQFIKEVQFAMLPCTKTSLTDSATPTQTSPTKNSLPQTSIYDVIKLVETNGMDEDDVEALTEYLRDAFQAWLRKQIENAVAQMTGNDFDRMDLCLKAFQLSFGPYSVEIFKSEEIPIPAGPVILMFQMGILGFYGAEFSVEACVLSMKAVGRIYPRLGSQVWASLSAKIFIFRVGLNLTGYLLTTGFPTKAEIEFSQFPLDVKARMDLELIPLKIELHAVVTAKLLWKTKTILNKLIWHYQSPTIKKNIFNLNNAEPDESPPDFSWYSKAKCRDCDTKKNDRKKRQEFEGTPRCVVYQVVGRDYTDPAYVIELAVEDDKSPVTIAYCVGTYKGGCDVIKDQELGGTTTITEKMETGQRLYFTITAKNNAGMATSSQCELPTYDMTLPTGRVIPTFRSSSHPNILQSSVFMTEDSEITETKIGVGYGKDMYGFQVVDWQAFTQQPDDDSTYVGSDPLTRFHAPKEGKLPWIPFYRESHDEPEACARVCLTYSPSKCQAFNYDYHANGLCELLDIVHGEIDLQKSSLFYHYERRGVGKLATFDFQNLDIQHDKLVFFNVFVRNNLDYTNILSSEGVLIDLTIPSPCSVLYTRLDETSVEPCTEFTPDDLHQRCSTQTTIPNYRYIIDSDGSKCLFTGSTPMVNELYTRANRMAVANWDGIHDNETGILMYTWSVGTEACGVDIHPHRDPHAHLSSESEWDHVGVAYPLSLADGPYWVTVRALNKVEFGGPLALTICHDQPFIVDNTPPVVHHVGDAAYDEFTEVVTIYVNASDELSLIKSVDFGLGRSRRDTYILEWQEIEEHFNISYDYRLPNGIPVWVKLRFTNNVDLKTVDHAPRALFVDFTPPLAGIISHGERRGHNHLYQWESGSLCVVWEGFHDPESGISEYLLAAGTSPYSEDISPYVALSHSATSHCFTDLHLQHKTHYYVTLIVFNGATVPKNNSAASQGILVDLTPPVSGTVRDSLPGQPESKFHSDPAIIEASWEGFSDPESGLDSSQADVVRKLKGATEATVIHEESLDPNTDHQMELHHMHFYHGDEVHVTVSVTNGAGSSSVAASDGFTVDLTDPVMLSLVDGYNTDVDMKYTASLSELSASWSFEDMESGVVQIRFIAYSKVGGKPSVIYPADGTYKELDPNVTTWRTDEPLTLTPGGFYYIRIAALNGAGLTAVHDTDGVIVDPSPPTILFVYAGVLSGATEEVMDGYVWTNNPEGLKGSWKAVDAESGISEYLISVGVSEGDDSILSTTSVGTDLDRYIQDLSLDLTDPDTNVPVYYINVVAINGAGMSSIMKTSTPVRVVQADQTGQAWDGPGLSIEMDEDYVSGHYSVTIHFSGFESELNGISHYMWALGTRPRSDDVKGYSSYGILTTDINSRGLGSSGFAQEILQLEPGMTYFATVRAITGDGSALDSSTDGFTVDSTNPLVSLSVRGPTADIDYTDIPVIYRQTTAVELQPVFMDTESGIADVWVSVGSYKGGNDISDKIPVSDSEVIFLDGRSGGQPTYFSVTAANHVGLTASGLSPVLVVDQTEPEEGELSCPPVINANDITCSWSGNLDRESGVDKFLFGIGSTEGLDNIIEFFEVNRDGSSITVANDGNFVLTHNAVYYATLATENNVGLISVIYSTAMRSDDTPPVSGWIVELPDFVDVNVGLQTAHSSFIEITKDLDIVCQRDITKVEIAWEEFTDEESGMDYYEVALGSTPGGTQIQQFTKVQGDSMRYTIYPVDLAAVRQVFASVRGFNGVGLFSVAVSNGVYISRHSAGLPPLSPLLVIDGNQLDDIDYLYDNDRLYAHWNLLGDPCPVKSMSLTVHKFDGTIAAPPEILPLDTIYAEEDEISMRDGESFFVELRVTNALGYSYSIHSDGVTIQLEPLIPGQVLDGNTPGVDLNFQPSTDTLSANWNGFGSDKDPQTFSEYPSDISSEIGSHQTVSHYEVAIGTDRRYPSTRDNVHPFINVGLNKTWTFNHLDLIAKTSHYYVTVRAYSMSTTMVEVTSNGIRVGYGGHIVALGEILMDPYVITLEEVLFSWTDFEFLVPVLHYYIGLKAGITDTEDIMDCSDMISTDDSTISMSGNFTSMFDVYPLTGVGLDTFIQLSNLSLDQGGSYTAFVVALDQSGTCAMIGQGFGADMTTPTEGKIGIGPDLDLAVLYVPSTEEFTVWWDGFRDEESGLMEHSITLMLGLDCDNFDPRQMTTVVDSETLSPTSRNFTYLEVDLQIGLPYYIILEVTNNAGLTTQTVSKPIIVDINGPTAGRVVDGTDFKHDLRFHGNPTAVEGRILYLPDPSSEACPYRTYDMTSKDSDWSHIVHKGMWSRPDDRIDNIVFLDKQISYGPEGVTLTMENDITKPQILSGALYSDAQISQGAFYEFTIQAASDMYGVTSVSLVDWNKGILADFHSTIFHGNETEQTEPVDTGDNPGYTVIENSLTGDTFPEEYAMEKQIEGNSFGFHIVRDPDGLYHVILWALTTNSTRTLDFELEFDPTAAFHTYTLLVNDGEFPLTEDDWSVKLLIDNQYLGDIAGVSAVGETATVLIGLYNNHGLMEETADVFYAPKTSAMFKKFRFSASSDELCRYGNPFIGGDHPIVEFFAGVGSEDDLDDVIPFQKAAEPCIPCIHPCDEKICHPDCDHSTVQLIDIVLDEIQLEPLADTQTENVTLPAAYYLTVKGITGSGKDVLASSNGFYIDVTPPVIGSIYHIDPSWTDYEPTEFQGSNSSIGAYWEVTEDESMILNFLWAIGTIPLGTDIQDYVDVGMTDFVLNENLEGMLENNRTYYVTVQAINSAGLVSYKSSEGITTYFDEPDFSDTSTSIEGATPIGDPSTSNTVETQSQTSIEFSWENPSPSQVEAIYCGVGSTENDNDIFPETMCGLNGSGSVSISSEGFSANGEEKANFSSLNHSRKKRSLNQLLMEPGRKLYSRLTICNKAHKCSKFPMKTIIIRRSTDTMLIPDGNDKITGHIRPSMDKAADYIEIYTPENQNNSQYIMVGFLTESDLQVDYKSDASNTFKSYISDPASTIKYTSRELRGRILQYLEGGFYITASPDSNLNGPVEITVGYSRTYFNRSMVAGRPTLLVWCSVEEIWMKASDSCKEGYFPMVDWENNMFTTPVCDVKSLCGQELRGTSKRTRRQADSGDREFTGPGSFVVAGVSDQILNNPPIIITDTTYNIPEDVGTIAFTIAAGDPDTDDIEFLLHPNSTHNGTATLDLNGQATYKPFKDIFGTDEVKFIVREVRTDGISPLQTEGVMTIYIEEVNDNPGLMFVHRGEAVMGTVTSTVDQYQESESERKLTLLLVSYDVDMDSISFTLHGNEYGTVMRYSQSVTHNIVHQNCNGDWSERQKDWDLVVESILNQNEFTLPVPCGVEEETKGESVNWVVTVVEYTPNKGFLGLDKLEVLAYDEHGLVSHLLNFDIYVLANPCVNNARCEGPSWDTSCSDTARINGFESYTCSCAPGFSGSTCDKDINECLSSPCPTNHTCVDQINAYKCICQDGWPCNEDGGLDGSTIGVIIVTLILVILLGLIIAFVVYKRWRRYSDRNEAAQLFQNDQNTENPDDSQKTKQIPPRKYLYFQGSNKGSKKNRELSNSKTTKIQVSPYEGGKRDAASHLSSEGYVNLFTNLADKESEERNMSDPKCRADSPGDQQMSDVPIGFEMNTFAIEGDEKAQP